LRKQNAQYEAWYGKLRASGEKTLAAPPSTYEIPDGLRYWPRAVEYSNA
jgi:hypothetical protein